jgi:hypothetical protein
MNELPVKQSTASLPFCLIMDAVGCISFFIPAFAEVTDVIWAPISAYLFMRTFKGNLGKIGAAINFIEEIIPFTDFIPSFTIAWFIEKYVQKNETA